MKLDIIIYIIMLFVIVLSIHLGAEVYDINKENESFNIYNYTDDVSFTNEQAHLEVRNASTGDSNKESFFIRASNIINYFIRAFINIFFESIKIAIEFGYNSQGEYDFLSFIYFIKTILVLLLASILFWPTVILGFLIHEIIKKNKKKNNNTKKQNCGGKNGNKKK